jgi:hypothetical protein
MLTHILIAVAIVLVGSLLVWLGVRQYNSAAKTKVDPRFIFAWQMGLNRQIGMGLGVFLGIVGVVLGCYGVYYGFEG